MATLKIKSATSALPATLTYRELGIYNNEMYFGNASNTPVKLALASSLGSYLPLTAGSSQKLSGDLYANSTLKLWGSTPGTVVGNIHIGALSSTTNYGPALTFGSRDSAGATTAQAGIYIMSDGAYGTKMLFGTSNNYTTGSVTRMLIDHNGLIGIGTTTPISTLDVNGPVAIESKVKLDYNATTLSLDFIFV